MSESPEQCRFLRAELPADADLVAELRARMESGWHLVWIERDDRGKLCMEMREIRV